MHMQRKIENEDQLVEFCNEKIRNLEILRKDRNKFLRENLTEEEIKEYNFILEDNK